MKVEMWDMDVPFEISNDTNADGVDFVRISTSIGADESNDNDICLTRDQVEDFIDALRFIAKRLK